MNNCLTSIPNSFSMLKEGRKPIYLIKKSLSNAERDFRGKVYEILRAEITACWDSDEEQGR